MNTKEAEQRIQEILDLTKDWSIPREEKKIYIIDNGKSYSDHSLYFCETDLRLPMLKAIVGLSRGWEVIGIASELFAGHGAMSESSLFNSIGFDAPDDNEDLGKEFVDIPIPILHKIFEYRPACELVEILEAAYETQLITRLAGLNK